MRPENTHYVTITIENRRLSRFLEQSGLPRVDCRVTEEVTLTVNTDLSFSQLREKFRGLPSEDYQILDVRSRA